MDNRINFSNNIVFCSRYLVVKNPEQFPQQVYEAIYKNDAIDSFLHAKPKKLLGKFIDFFRKNGILNVEFISKSTNKYDPYSKTDIVDFTYKRGKKINKHFSLSASQKGVKRPSETIPKLGEHHTYKAPAETTEVELAKQIDAITDIKSLLK